MECKFTSFMLGLSILDFSGLKEVLVSVAFSPVLLGSNADVIQYIDFQYGYNLTRKGKAE